MSRTAIAFGVILSVAALQGCGNIDHRSEDWQQHYGPAAADTERENLERKRIYAWEKDPRQKQRIGMLEKYRIRLKGSRDWHEMYYILNAGCTTKIGFINEDGVFFKYDREGRLQRVGEYPIIDTGLKIFYELPLNMNLALEDFDPYKD